MGYEAYLQDLLGPLGVYVFRAGSISGGELAALGASLDGCSAQLDRVERESISVTAEGEGLDRREALFARKPAAHTLEQRRAAIAALLQIGGDSFSPEAIQRAIQGCGILAEAIEMPEWGHIRIVFPGVAGIPAEFAQIEKIILDIIPCHLETEFYFRYITWAECEARALTWEVVEDAEHTWYSFELWIEP